MIAVPDDATRWLHRALRQRTYQSDDSLPTDVQHFASASVPSISLLLYIQRFRQAMAVPTAAFTQVVVIHDRLVDKLHHPVLFEITAHRMAITLLCAALKVVDDYYPGNARMAMVGGIAPHELAAYERWLYRTLDWDVSECDTCTA